MNESEKQAGDLARKLLRDLNNAKSSEVVCALEDVICYEFVKVARLKAQVLPEEIIEVLRDAQFMHESSRCEDAVDAVLQYVDGKRVILPRGEAAP